jgi:hypothetical protein
MNFNMRNLWLTYLVALAALLIGGAIIFKAGPAKKSVRVLYLIPKDRQYSKDYQSAIEACVLDLQAWYAEQLNGKTFRLNDPIVEVERTMPNAQWYDDNVPTNRPEKKAYTFYNTVKDAARFSDTNASSSSYDWPMFDTDYAWLIYIDAPGGSGAGANGVAVLPRHDLQGLVGKATDNSPIQRWIGGSGHELGHAFGLLHPRDVQTAAIMQTGYANYPACALTATDIKTLNASPFLREWQPPGWKLFLFAVLAVLVVLWIYLRNVATKRRAISTKS